MRSVLPGVSRRMFAFGLAGAALVAPRAAAAPELTFPLRIAFARIGPRGFAAIRSRESAIWTAMQVRLGGLIEDIAPLQSHGLLGIAAPETDGGASCVLAARTMAADAGFDQVLIYATDSGTGPAGRNRWLSRAFASLRASVLAPRPTTGEAHLLDIGGGHPLLSATSDAAPLSPLNLFDGYSPESAALNGLAQALEHRLQAAARPHYAAEASIAD
ncbi:MAG: hypothetical protein SGJ21_00375 [Alphaproteobacteria bacterium]|nr:hypothetical protein [Alphaproteobacteria bacterium]